MKIAISIPTYKREKDLERLVASINSSSSLADPDTNIKLFIRDNNPKSEILLETLEYLGPLLDIRYTKNKKNEGGRMNIWENLIIASEKSDLVIILSDDDYVLPDFISTISKHWQKYKTDYLVTSFYTQYPNFQSSLKQYGLEKPFLNNFFENKKIDLIISNRILSGTCLSSQLIKRMHNLCEKSFYMKQHYQTQFAGCFANSCARLDSKLVVHQVGNQIFWEDYEIFKDMIYSRIEGFIYAYKVQNGNKKELEILLLKFLINQPMWISIRLLFSKLDFSWRLRRNFFIYKPFHLKIIRDFLRILFNIRELFITKYLKK